MGWITGRISLMSKTIGLNLIDGKSSLESVRKARDWKKAGWRGGGSGTV